MCVLSSGDDLALIAHAVDSADAILARAYGVRIQKAAGIGTPRGFERAVARLAGILRDRATPTQAAAARAAGSELGLDWRALTPRARVRAVERAARAAREITAAIPDGVRSA